jgi:hypothetical protein
MSPDAQMRPGGGASDSDTESLTGDIGVPTIRPTADTSAGPQQPTMTARERGDLAALTRRREKVAKSQVDSVAAERVAEAEEQLSAVFASDDELWRVATDIAKTAVADANRVIAEKWEAAGRPAQFAPSAHFMWAGRGQNMKAERRAELRLAARTRIAADAKRAKAVIEATSVEIQTELVSDGLTGDAARKFLESMPSPTELLPRLDVAGMRTEIEAQNVAQLELTSDYRITRSWPS